MRLFFVVALLISGCSSWSTDLKYRKKSYIPGSDSAVIGYEDSQIGEKSYIVKVGQAWPSDWPNLEKVALYRAAEITKSRGGTAFIVHNSEMIQDNYLLRNPTTVNTFGSANSYNGQTNFSATSYISGGGSSVIQGGRYFLEFTIILSNEKISINDKIIYPDEVFKRFGYYIDSIR